MARPRLDALVALPRRLARAGARSAPEALPLPIAARHGREVVKADLFRGHCLLLDGLHLDEVAHLLELSAQRRGILLDHHVLMMLEADRLERAVQPPRVPDAAPDLPDAHLPRGQLVLAGLLWPLAGVPHERPRHVTPSPSTWPASGSRASRARRRARARPDPPW